MGDTESLVQVQVTNVSTKDTWLSQPNQSIQIGAIDIHLSATFVNDATDVSNTVFENSVSRWIRHHDCGEFVASGVNLGLQFNQVHISLFIARNNNNRHSSHHCARGICSMSA